MDDALAQRLRDISPHWFHSLGGSIAAFSSGQTGNGRSSGAYTGKSMRYDLDTLDTMELADIKRQLTSLSSRLGRAQDYL
ncbi:MAG: hypothetical protein OHK0012_03440 [Synechococcales cyanobacterium]